MVEQKKGHCKHGEFVLTEGCPQCIEERFGIKAVEHESPQNIVKVQYYSETTGELSAVDVSEAEIAAFKDKVKTIPADSVIKVDKPRTTEELSQDEIEAEAREQATMERITGIRPEQDELEEGLNAEGLTLATELQPETAETALIKRPGADIEVRSYYDEALKLLGYAEARTITSLVDAKSATNDLSIISRLKKAMEAKRKEKLAPHEAQVKAIRDTYNFLMTPVLEAERITKEKQVAYIHEQERIQREQEEINRKRLEAAEAEMKLKGELTESVNLVEINEAPSRVQTDFGSSGMVDHWKVEVTDMSALPNEYKIPDMVMLNAIAKKYHDAKKIPGVRFYNEPYLATRTR